MVLVHEFGHFWSAKKFGIRVDEFGFGFPPKIWSIKKGETEYSLNLLPIGGFVRIFGENPNEENINGPDSDRSFVNKAKWKQAVVLFAGVFANFILAWFLFSMGFMSGLPASVDAGEKNYNYSDVSLMVVSVLPDSPADVAGLEAGDKIISIRSGENYTEYVSPETVQSFVQESNGEEIEFVYRRDITNVENTVSIIPELLDGNDTPRIGISMDQVGIAKLPFFKAFWEGMKLTLSMTKNTALGLFGLIVDAVSGRGSFDAVAGPVGMVGIVGDAYNLGFVYLLSFAALISINLAIINLLPFPALDGGRLLFVLIEKIKGSPISPKISNTLNMIGFGILILLMIVITYHDITRIF